MEFIESQKVIELLQSYPTDVRKRLYELRSLIIEAAEEAEEVDKLLETTKWNEPSYVTRSGSTIRMDWKRNNPDCYYLFFICSTELVHTFRWMAGEELRFEKNRAIVFDLGEPLPVQTVKRCISLALRYHKVKHLPMLGV